jgi:hypothetical protein
MPLLAYCSRCEGRGWYWVRVRTAPDVIRVVEISCPVGCVATPCATSPRRPGRVR